LPSKANLRPKEIATFLDISLSKIYELIGAGELPSCKVGNQYRIPRDRFLLWLSHASNDKS
jgi:excisionase family DNA binding protein